MGRITPDAFRAAGWARLARRRRRALGGCSCAAGDFASEYLPSKPASQRGAIVFSPAPRALSPSRQPHGAPFDQGKNEGKRSKCTPTRRPFVREG